MLELRARARVLRTFAKNVPHGKDRTALGTYFLIWWHCQDWSNTRSTSDNAGIHQVTFLSVVLCFSLISCVYDAYAVTTFINFYPELQSHDNLSFPFPVPKWQTTLAGPATVPITNLALSLTQKGWSGQMEAKDMCLTEHLWLLSTGLAVKTISRAGF